MGLLTPPRPVPRDALVAAALVGAINALLWSMLVVAVRVSWDNEDRNPFGQELAIGAVTLVAGLVLVAICLVAGLPQRRLGAQLVGAVLLSVAFGGLRAALDQRVLPLPNAVWWEWGISTIGYLVVASPAILVSTLVARRRRERDARIAERARNLAATAALEQDEAELRREVAEHLHGTVQNRLVIVAAALDELANESDTEHRPERAERLRSWARMIDTVREEDVRTISHQVFPTGLDLGLTQAVGLLLDRLPTTVATSIHLGDGVRELDQRLSMGERLVLAATVQEGLTNALLHGQAHRVAVDLAAEDGEFTVIVEDDGVGLPADGVRESGLLRQRARVEGRGGRLELASRPEGGTRLRVALPVG